jgi:hypothetical protein
MELVLIKIYKEYNKFMLEMQDKIKLSGDKEQKNKKNEIIEGIRFYFHSIINKWFMLVLFRN